MNLFGVFGERYRMKRLLVSITICICLVFTSGSVFVFADPEDGEAVEGEETEEWTDETSEDGYSVEEAEEKTFEVYSSNIKKLLVNNMMLVPSFVPDEHVPLDLLKQQVQGGYFSNIGVEALNDYIKDLSRVSEQMMRLHQIRMFQLFNFIDTQSMVPMQVTSGQEINNKMWMGTFVSFEDKICDAFIYVMMSPENLRLDSEEKVQIAGVVLDHWIERIPYTNQTAGLSFNYDQPDAESPQTLLMAVASRNTGHHWSYNMLLRTIRSTMHLVKSRAVEPDDLKTHPWTCAVFPLINYGKINTNAKSSR